MRYRTPRAFNASSSARSADVRASSNTGQTAAEPLRGREFETSEGVVHVARVHARICPCDGMRLAPEGLAVEHPVTLLVRQVFDVRESVAHRQ
jgi:hypothetical protein